MKKSLQQGLFKYSWDQVEKEGCSKYHAEVLFNANLLSFNPNETKELENFELAELIFLKALYFDSGLPKEAVLAMLSGLKKPYCYSFREIYWDFEKKEWKDFPLLEELEIEDLIEQLAEDDELDRLKEVQKSLELTLEEHEFVEKIPGDRNDDLKDDYYGSMKTAYIDAEYVNGIFYDVKTKKAIKLKDDLLKHSRRGVAVRIIAPLYSIIDSDYKLHTNLRKEVLLKKEERLHFLLTKEGDNRQSEFTVELREDLFLTQKGNKFSSLESCRCLVFDEKANNIIEAESINEAFTKTSVKYRPNNRTHSCNVFKTMQYKGKYLENLRKF